MNRERENARKMNLFYAIVSRHLHQSSAINQTKRSMKRKAKEEPLK
jgi:hypothetical protein